MEIKRRWSRWDDSYKNYTKDCSSCEWYNKIDNQELCGWGIAFKHLIRTEKPRKCEVRNREQTENRSIRYLDELVRENCA